MVSKGMGISSRKKKMKPTIKFSPAQEAEIQKELLLQRGITKIKNREKFKWDSGAVKVIKDQIEARKKLNLHNDNDWKIKFLQDKLKLKSQLMSKLRKII